MPLAALAIPAIIGAVGSIAGGISSADSAKSAANTVANKDQQVAASIGTATTNAQNAINTNTTTAQAGVTGAAQSANTLLNPYAAVGSSAASQLQNGNFGQPATAADVQQYMSPAVAFQLQQGQIALQRSAAAKGGALGGGAAKSLANYSAGLASEQYQNAFNNYQTATQNAFGNLNSMAGMGMSASSQQGSNLTNAAQWSGQAGINAAQLAGQEGMQGTEAAGNALMGGAQATAAGQIGQGNAINNMIGGVSKSASAFGAAGGFGGGGVSVPLGANYGPSTSLAPWNLPSTGGV